MSPEYSYLRVEKHQIKPSNKYYKLLDELCFKSKNLYNTGLYVERQAFLEKDQNLKGIRFIPEFTLINYLKERKIGTIIHYPVPPHLAEAYIGLGYQKGDFPITERLADTVLSIPVYNGMTEKEIDYVVDCINKFRGD